jgi:hypothetical protein
MILQVLIAMIAGWINRHQQQVIAYLLEENRILHAKLGNRRIRFTDAERRRLATLAFPLGRKRLKSLATLATPDTLMRWYKQLVAQKFDGNQKRNKLGRPRVSDEIEALVLHMDNDNPTWGYRRIQGALANLGHHIDKITVRNILRRHHHQERNHPGLDNQLIAPEVGMGGHMGQVVSRERLGGLLNYYYREAA